MTARDAAPTPEGVVLGVEEREALYRVVPVNDWDAEADVYATVQRIIAARLAAERAAHEGQVAALVSALTRTEANFVAAVNGRPVRDMTETLAENRAALRDGCGDKTCDEEHGDTTGGLSDPVSDITTAATEGDTE